jgi:ankyrin repeat protein
MIKHFVSWAIVLLAVAHNTVALQRITAHPENPDLVAGLASSSMQTSGSYPSADLKVQIALQNDLFYDEREWTEQEEEAAYRAGKSLLFDALDNPAEVQRLIAEGEDVNHEDFGGATPLHWVFIQKTPNLETAEIIHQKGGNIHSLDHRGNTPLDYAVRRAKSPRNIAGAEWLLAKGADPNGKSKQTLLLYASVQFNIRILELLLEAGADPNTPRHFPPLYLVMQQNRFFDQKVDLLLAHGANPVASTNGHMTPLAYTLRHYNAVDRLGIMQKVYEEAQRRGTPYTAEQLRKALFEFRGERYVRDVFEQFLEWNVDVNQKITRNYGGFTRLLIIACGDDKVDIDAIQHLLDKGANPTLADHNGDTPLHAAIRTGAPETVLLLLEKLDAQAINQVNKHGQTALHFCSGSFHPDTFYLHWSKRYSRLDPDKLSEDEELRQLLVDGTLGQRRETPDARYADLIQALLSKGASPYAHDALTGGTPLHYACRHGVPELVTALLEGCSGECLRVKDNLAQTPLHWAAKHGKASTAQALMEWSQGEQNSSLDDDDRSYARNLPCVVDEKGHLPLHIGAMKGNDDTMDVLLEYTPATHYEVKDSKGHTPWWLAAYYFEKDDDDRWVCDVSRHDHCADKIKQKIKSARGVGPLYYFAFAAVASLVISAVVFRSAIAGAAGAAIDLGHRLCVEAWRGGEIGWRWATIAWRCVVAGAVAGWKSMRDEYLKIHEKDNLISQ